MRELLSMARGLKDSYSLRNKQKKNISSHGSPCSRISGGYDPTLEVGKHAPSLAKDSPPHVTTIPSEASDPYTIANTEPGGNNTSPSDAFTTEAPQTHQHGALDRPKPEPPDRS